MEQEKSILIIDDSPASRRQLARTLEEAGVVSRFFEAADGLEAMRKLLDRPVDVILCDLEMPGIDGIRFLSLRNAREELKDIPLIMLTGRADRQSKLRCLEEGASDFVTKPFDAEELVARVGVQLKIKALQDSLKESNRLLLKLSNTDALTRLCNRRCMMQHLQRELTRSERESCPLALAMMDIDHFKQVNDNFGHQCGDMVLVRIAEMLERQLRPYDTAARFGGEEFALVLPGTDLEQARSIAERVREAIEELRFDPPLEHQRLTVSLGVAAISGEDGQNVDDLIRRSDEALYRAKRGGRNRVMV